MTTVLQDLFTTGDALLAGGDLGSLVHVVAEIERSAELSSAADLLAAKATIQRWQAAALDRRMALGAVLLDRRVQRGAVRAYGHIAAA